MTPEKQNDRRPRFGSERLLSGEQRQTNKNMTKRIEVKQTIVVTVDESKFTPEFMANFSRYFFDCDTIEDHIAFIAKSYAMGIVQSNGDFLEGYGVLRDFGINVQRDTTETEATELEAA